MQDTIQELQEGLKQLELYETEVKERIAAIEESLKNERNNFVTQLYREIEQNDLMPRIIEACKAEDIGKRRTVYYVLKTQKYWNSNIVGLSFNILKEFLVEVSSGQKKSSVISVSCSSNSKGVAAAFS